jgi:NhaA family Na+:H+ antiporter
MPTDLAVAIAVLAIAMPRSAPGLRVFLLALAIVDDIGTIVVVALVYPVDVAWGWIAVAIAVGAVMVALERIHVRAVAVYVGLGAGMWLALEAGGVPPTLAGVALGLLTPAVPFQRPRAVSEEAHRVADATLDFPPTPDADAPEWLRLAGLSREAVSPLARAEAALHPWTSYAVVPLFALANAGLTFGGGALDGRPGQRVAIAIVLARVVGKPLGIALACAAAIGLGLARRPEGTSPRQLVGVGFAAGVPFTVSLFVAELALPPELHDAARVGIFVSALLAAALGVAVLRGSRESEALDGARPLP